MKIKTNKEMYQKLAEVQNVYEETKDETLEKALDIIERMKKIIELGDKASSHAWIHGFRFENDKDWQELHPDYYEEYLKEQGEKNEK